MGQLFEAYKNSRDGNHRDLIAISQYSTDSNEIRRVVGDKPGYIYNNDILALDQETIDAVYHLAEMRGRGPDYALGKEWVRSLTPLTLEKIVNEMIACKEILTENMNIDYDETYKIYDETDISKRAIGKVQYRVNDEIDKFLHPENVGINSFGIKDYELNWQQLMERKNKAWTKTGGKLLKFLDGKLNPDAERNNPDRIGNRTVQVPKEYTGGER